MAVHDWARVDAGIFHALSNAGLAPVYHAPDGVSPTSPELIHHWRHRQFVGEKTCRRVVGALVSRDFRPLSTLFRIRLLTLE